MTYPGVSAASRPASPGVRRLDHVLLALAVGSALLAVGLDVGSRTGSVTATTEARLLAAVSCLAVAGTIVLAVWDRAERDAHRRRELRIFAFSTALLSGGTAVGYLLTARAPDEIDPRVRAVPLLVSLPFATYALLRLCWPNRMTHVDRRIATIDSLVALLSLVIIWWAWVVPRWVSAPGHEVWDRIDQVAMLGALGVTAVIGVVSRRIGSLPLVALGLLLAGVTTYLVSDTVCQLLPGADGSSAFSYSIVGFAAASGLTAAFALRPALEVDPPRARRRREQLSAGVPVGLAGLAGLVVIGTVSDHLGSNVSLAAVGAGGFLLVGILVARMGAAVDLRSAQDDAAALLLVERTREGWFRALLGDSSEGLLVLDGTGAIVYMSPVVVRDFATGDDAGGAAAGGPAPQLFSDLLIDVSAAEVRLILAQVSIDPSRSGPYEMLVRGHDGRDVEVEVVVRPILDVEFEGYVATARDVSDARRLQRQLDSSHRSDPLTGLLSREAFLAAVQSRLDARDLTESTAVLVLDLERFGSLNDGLGHEVGDEILVSVAKAFDRLPSQLHAASRLSGDSFAWLVVATDIEQAIGETVDQCRSELRGLLLSDGRELEISFRAGYVVTGEVADAAADWCLEAADLALARSRASRHAVLVEYRGNMREETERRVAAEHQLRWALAEDRLEVFYQPVVQLSDGAVFGAEALVRLRDRDGGLVAPDSFIPVAEEIGLIGEIGSVVLRRACEQTVEASLRLGRRLHVSVNVAPDQLVPQLVLEVTGCLSDTGLDPDRLTLEITEATLADRTSRTQGVLHDLRALGVTVSVDDFGTGYSSMSFLATLPVDGLKIDRSFVSVMGTSTQGLTLARLVVQLAAALGLEAVAEGVETIEQADLLRGMGCRYAQGYLYSRPVPFEDYLGLLRGPLGSVVPEL